MSGILPDPSTPFGEAVARRLRDDIVIWLTTVGADGTPQPNPVWFLWDGATVLVYSHKRAKRNDHIRARPQVSLHFDSLDQGESAIIITGVAAVDASVPPAHELPEYVAKYRQRAEDLFPGQPPENFSQEYPVAIRITPKRVRGF